MAHVIRLHGPWTAVFDQDSELRQVTFRAPSGLSDSILDASAGSLGAVRLLRKFNRPSGIQGDEVAVDLAIGVSHACRILMNESVMGELPAGEHRLAVKHRLAMHNELAVEMHLGSACSSVRCDARLIIEDSRPRRSS